MKIIKTLRVEEYARDHSVAAASLIRWIKKAKAADWADFKDVKCGFGNADAVEVDSSRIVVVFNIAGNKFRLITAIHYNIGKVYVLRFLTHAEYSKDKWKRNL